MQVLVTGGSGMIGQSIKKLKPDWIYTSSKDVDLRNYVSTLNYISKYNPRTIIHLAANVGGLFKNMNNQSDMLYDNLLINMNVVKVCALLDIRLICCLSTCIFPDATTYPITEDMLHDGPPHESNFGYAYAKRILDIACQSFPRLNYTCIIPCNVYGPFDNFNLANSHVVPALIHKAYLAKELGDSLQVYGTGSPLRQFIYAPDVARIIVDLLSITAPKRLILAPKDEHSIGYITKFIANAYQINYVFDNDVKKDGQYKKTVSNDLFTLLFPDFHFTSIETGLLQTMDWFDANYGDSRK